MTQTKHSTLLLLLCLCLPFYSWGQASLEILLNGKAIEKADLEQQFLCLDLQDSITVRMNPGKISEQNQFVLIGIQLWTQQDMGGPKQLGQIGPSKPAAKPEFTFALNQFKLTSALPPSKNSLRSQLKLGQLIEVKGKQFQGYVPVPDEAQSIKFLLVSKCIED